MNDQQTSLPTVPEHESYQAGSSALPVNKPTGKVFSFMNGWIKLHRAFLDWGWFSDEKMVRFFIYLLLKANYEDGDWMGVKIKRGELVTGRKVLSQNLQLPEQTVRTLLSRLKSTNEITIKSTNKYSIITICNYEYYQNFNSEINQQDNQQTPNEQPTTNQQLTTIEEVKESKKRRSKKIPPDPKESEANPLTQKVIDSYFEWYEKQTTIKPKFLVEDAAAAKQIAIYITKTVKYKNPNADEIKIMDAWHLILNNFTKWDKFYQGQLKLSQINSNLTNIIANIKGVAKQKEIKIYGLLEKDERPPDRNN